MSPVLPRMRGINVGIENSQTELLNNFSIIASVVDYCLHAAMIYIYPLKFDNGELNR